MGNSDHSTTYMRVGGDDGELRPWYYIYVYSIESRLIRRVIYESKSRSTRRAARRGAGHVPRERTHRGDGRALDGHTPRDPPRPAVRVACRVLGPSQTAPV